MASILVVIFLVSVNGDGQVVHEASTAASEGDSSLATDVPGSGRRVGQPRRAMEAADALPAEPTEHPDEPRWIEPEAARLHRVAPDADAADEPLLLFGLMHAHTFISDGSGAPEEAFARAAAAGLDFLGVTPHNHSAAEGGAQGQRRDGVMVARTPRLYDGADPVTVTRRFEEAGQQQEEVATVASLQAAATAATADGFVALFGQEFSTISSGNHVNVFQPRAVITDIANGAYRPFFERFGASDVRSATVVQLNHPNVHDDLFYAGSAAGKIRKMFNDYGYDEYGESFAALVEAADPIVALVEVLSGPALDPSIHPRFHYADGRLHENDYYFYLVQGFHVSPSAGQDNHFETWGTSTPARMGVYASAATPDALISALRANRTYATEDSDLALRFSCGGREMGSVLVLGEGSPIQCSVRVSDPSDADSRTEVDLFYGDVQAASSRDELVEWRPRDGLVESLAYDGVGRLSFDGYLASGVPEFFYVRVQQADGDRAWSAPIWVNHPRPR